MSVVLEPQETEERADHVTAQELMDLTADSEFFKHIREKLLGRGAKLISGPRGTGKTHQMRFVHLECAQDKAHPLAVYVSFSRYARLEPLLRTAADALKIFHSWVLAKIISGIQSFGQEAGVALDEIIAHEVGVDVTKLEAYVSEVENGDRLRWHEELQPNLNMTRLHSVLRAALSACKRSRCILLLDDAALSLTPEYLVEFFNIFQDLKAPSVSPKASVYPGTTQYGPRFHVRHDAETVNAWLSVDEPDYSEVMGELLSKRTNLSQGIPSEVVELFKYLAFGVPRVLLTMLRAYGQLASHPNRTVQQNVNTVVEEQVRLLSAEYQSLAYKLPQFKSVIGAGFRLFNTVADEIVSDNRRLQREGIQEKQTVIGIQREKRPPTHERMIRFLVEVGLLYPLQPVQHGEDREYDRYIPHYARLMQARAFAIGRGFSARDVVTHMRQRSTKHPLRRSLERLLSVEDRAVKLDLAPCERCHTPRMDEAQRFCHQCGAQLPEHSRYQECLQMPIEALPIPEWYKENIREATNLKVIGDLLVLQDPASELRKAHMIGKKRSLAVLEAAKHAVEEFLS